MRTSIPLTVQLVLAVMLLAPTTATMQGTTERSRTEGLKETDRFVKAGGNASEGVAHAKLEIQKALDAYNALVTQPSTNMKSDYKKLIKSQDSMNTRVDSARSRLAEMQKVGDVYFNGRAESIKNIKDPQLQGRARQRLDDNQKEFAAMLQSLNEAGNSLEPFRKDLADHITFLGSDLTSSAMAALRPDAEKLNAQGADIFARADKAIASANAYFQSLRAAQG
jgi:hypothetical protein